MERLIAGRYRLLAPSGERTWRAQDELLHREVVVTELAVPADDLAQARAAARLDSPHVVTVYDVLEDDGCAWAVAERVDGPSLADLVRDSGPLPVGRVAEIGLGLLTALDAARAQGLAPRRVTPAAVLLRRDGRAVLAHQGSPLAAADEELASLGATLATAVEGCPPRPDGRLDLAGPLTPVLTGLLDPAHPLDSAATRRGLLEALGATPAPAATSRTTALPLPPPLSPPLLPPARPRSRRRAALLAAAALLVAAAGVGGFLASTRSTGSQAATATGTPRHTAAAAVPADWKTYDGEGWRIRYPQGWELGSYRGQTQLRDPATHRTVRVGPATLSGGPLAALTSVAGSFATAYPTYARLRLEQTADGGAVWELTYTGGGAPLHAADYALLRAGRGFTVFTQARAADWAASQSQLRLVVTSLTLA
jgi:hypothetical protein